MPIHGNNAANTVPDELIGLLRAAPSVWTSAELQQFGISSRVRRRLLDAGVLLGVQRGAYALREVAGSMGRDERAALRLAAHQKVYRWRAERAFAYSHSSAARLQGFQLWHADEFVHVTCRSNACPERFGPDVRTHQIPIAETEIQFSSGVGLTTVERTVVDCCRILDLEGSLVIMDQALRAGADRGRLAGYAERQKGHRGVVNLRQVLELGDGRSESMGETRTRFLLWLMNVSPPVPQFTVWTDRGSRRIDFAWPELKVALEFDGKSKYFAQVPTDQAIAEERIRERRLMELGWQFVRLDWQDLENPEAVKRRIHRAWETARTRVAA
ncbi:hypothetical protein [Arthrobacter sp. NPDC090010]|uniref:hypothetical protein n=1 Tax=Arthrobacter sp. NPDC090010 TaxID=3363942 RepID=UPI00380572DE